MKKKTTLSGKDAYAPVNLPAAVKKPKRISRPMSEPTGKIIPLELNQKVTDRRRTEVDPSFLERAMDAMGHSADCSRRQPSNGNFSRYPFDPDCPRCQEITKTIPTTKTRKKVKS